jgi:hypothetical protein
MQLQFLVDEIYEISDNGTNDFMTIMGKNGKSKQMHNRESIARSQLRINARMMVISKLAPILRARTRHIRGRYEVPDNENTELQDDQDTTAPTANGQKAVAKAENRAVKNIAGSSPKKTLKPAPGKPSISGARAVSAKAGRSPAEASAKAGPSPEPEQIIYPRNRTIPRHNSMFSPEDMKILELARENPLYY